MQLPAIPNLRALDEADVAALARRPVRILEVYRDIERTTRRADPVHDAGTYRTCVVAFVLARAFERGVRARPDADFRQGCISRRRTVVVAID